MTVVAGDPIERDAAVISGAEALPAEPDVGNRPEERGEDGLHVAVPSDHRKRSVRTGQGLDSREDRVASSLTAGDDFERRVMLRVTGHCVGGGGADLNYGGDTARFGSYRGTVK